jgi:hypothetical protein
VTNASIVIGSFGSLDWNVRVYAALSGVSRLAISVRDRANVLRTAYDLHKVNRASLIFSNPLMPLWKVELNPNRTQSLSPPKM